MSEQPYQPRESDHLVEPLFGGLGLGDEPARQVDPDDEERAEPSPASGVVARFGRWLRGE